MNDGIGENHVDWMSRCPRCEYDLRGLGGAVACPECGADVSAEALRRAHAALDTHRDPPRPLHWPSVFVFVTSPAPAIGLAAVLRQAVPGSMVADVAAVVVVAGAMFWAIGRAKEVRGVRGRVGHMVVCLAAAPVYLVAVRVVVAGISAGVSALIRGW